LISRAALLSGTGLADNSAIDAAAFIRGAESEFAFTTPTGTAARIVISTVLDEDRIAIHVTPKGIAGLGQVRITGADGMPLPEQLELADNDLVIGTIDRTNPTPRLQIEFTADGVVVFRKNLHIDLTTGRASFDAGAENTAPNTNRYTPTRALLPAEVGSLAAVLARP
jgi:hypothetical protein